jgi:hypothetical protein
MGMKYTEDEDFRSLLKTVRCFDVWLEHGYFNSFMKEDYNV